MSRFLGIVFLMATVVGMVSAADKTPPFKITTKRDNNKVEVRVEKKKTIVSIHSPFEISHAVVERTNDKWPDDVVLRLLLMGLESLRASNGMVTLDAAVSSHDDKQRVRLWKDGKEDTPLDANSLFWMEIHMIGGDDKPSKTIPLKDGYFEMTLPKALFEGNSKSITVNGIDFCR